jgi:hypothetical protein
MGKWVRLPGKPPVRLGLYLVVSCCVLAVGVAYLNAVHAFARGVLLLIAGIGALVIVLNGCILLIRSGRRRPGA